MKRFIAFAVAALLFCTVVSVLRAEGNPWDINPARTRLYVGDIVWVNGADVGDGIYFKDGWFDKNGYVFPHRFGAVDGDGLLRAGGSLRRAMVAALDETRKHENGHPIVKVFVWDRDGQFSYERWSYAIIPEQGVVLLNW